MNDIIAMKFSDKPAQISCLDHGYVRLIDCMPRHLPESETTADYAIAEAARCSYQKGTQRKNTDRALIRYLIRHNHSSPLEMVELKFKVKLPIFVARQMIRHRTANVNEMSGRYSVFPDEYYVPDTNNVRWQSQSNAQGSAGAADRETARHFSTTVENLSRRAYQSYEEFIDADVAREQARMILSLNYYTEWYWKIDLGNLLHFLALRCDAHAQQEIRVYADAMLALITPIVPVTIEAWNDYHPLRNALLLTGLEVAAIKETLQGKNISTAPINTGNKREQQEWLEKSAQLGLTAPEETHESPPAPATPTTG